MDDTKVLIIFGLLVAGAIFFIGQLLVVPGGGSNMGDMKRLKKRLEELEAEEAPAELPINLLRERFRRNPSLVEDTLGRIPGLRALARSLEIPGETTSGYVYILISLVLAGVGVLGVWKLVGLPIYALGGGLIMGSLPFIKRRMDETKRMELFEEQLVGALDLMIRALQAGYPFVETIRQVGREMDDPIGTEFRILFDEINGGVDMRAAFRNLLVRMPSISLMAVATTVALQRETGGNLAESLRNITGVIRGRFKFQRNVKTLTAEGRMSAWVMALMPFALFLFLYFMAPAMMIQFLHDPSGIKALGVGVGMIFLGVLWMRKMLNFDI
ncbi:MAG: hypothetical protein RLZZ09_1736 [Pseudomonadota bacterium]|jgi:tight adherence protein B